MARVANMRKSVETAVCGSGGEVCERCLGTHPAVKSALDVAERDAIHNHRRRITLRPGARLFGRGARIVIAHLTKGVVKLTPPNDSTQTAGILFAPEIVGGGDVRNFQAFALSECELCCFDAAAVRAIFAGHPHLAESFWQHSLDSLSWMRRDASLLNAADATSRVAALFWVIARRARETAGGDGAVEIVLPMTLADAATLLGLAAETVSRRIAALRNAGLLCKIGVRRYRIPDPERLHGFITAEG